MDEHQKPTKNKTNPSHVYEHNIIPGHEIDFDNELNLSSLPSLPDNENLVKDKIKNELKDYVYRIEDSTRNITIEITWNYLKN
jgi:hypothetical protein